jgi:hypothetical protein
MGENEPVDATWAILSGFLRDAVGQVHKGCGGRDSDRGFCLLPSTLSRSRRRWLREKACFRHHHDYLSPA